ncbi:acetyl-CoA carboxylase carboxyltransferase subunit alpha [Candidatus Pelagibacter bacterium]|nr:acetyl-CoA carboxylase carboxyltransferase subunit alpha [Candidatus Pelagibacter bacterium]MDA9624992.1 acetyl-CoA carboxylase carboxyltransferase subunit alpha [Candidatus Pelagibacter bacterium]
MKNYLEFEKEIKNLEEEMDGLKSPFGSEGISEVDTKKIHNTQHEINEKLKQTYANLNSWQKTLVARHEDRPKANFYIKKIFSQFTLLSGDRYFGDDKSVIAGFGLIDEKSVLIIGQEKGEDLNTRIERNFGMMRPEGYRKCIRLMQLANRFQIPVVSFIDTPGAYPGIGAEQRGQASAIANSIECCMSLTVPNISIIIGEGGSGGAIALASSNKVIMLENSIYSVISPEGCASILWRDPSKSLQAAEAMKLTAKDLLQLGIIDEIISEPLGGAHRDPEAIALDTKNSIIKNLKNFENLSKEEIYDQRKSKFLQIGREQGFSKSSKLNDSSLSYKETNFQRFKSHFDKNKFIYIGVSLVFLASLVSIIY